MAHLRGKNQNVLAAFQNEAMAMSQDKGEDGERVATTAVIVGGGPAGMIMALALKSKGFRVKVCEAQPPFTSEQPAPGQAIGPSEPLCFSPEAVHMLQSWGLSRKNEKGILEPDFGPNARQIPYRDIRSLSGRLIRRERQDHICMRPQDLCEHVVNMCEKSDVSVMYDAKVAHYVDIAWGTAAYIPADGTKLAGDFMVGADGVHSMVREYMLSDGERDDVVYPGYTQWQGAVQDSLGLFEFFDDAIQYFLGFEAYAVVYRLPRDTVNWTIVRPSKLEASNALAEWKVMMLNWPVNADGTVDIPTEQTMALRESFDLFDTDGSGALDMAELKTAMKTVGLEIPDKELQKMADTVDKDGSGQFEFSEYVEVVKLLLVRLREAEDAEGTVEEMGDLLTELEQSIAAKAKAKALGERRIYEMRKGGAVGKLELEERVAGITEEIAQLKEEVTEAKRIKASAEEIKKKKDQTDEFEWEVAKEALGGWLRTTQSHDMLRRLVLATQHPVRSPVGDKHVISALSKGRITLAGQAAHPCIPGALVGADDCVQVRPFFSCCFYCFCFCSGRVAIVCGSLVAWCWALRGGASLRERRCCL